MLGRVPMISGLGALGIHWTLDAMDNMAKLPFELSVTISRARLKPCRGTGIVEY